MGMVSTVLLAVWHYNRHIPGLGLWLYSYLCGFVFCVNLATRQYLPEVLSVVVAQIAIPLSAYLALLGSRAYLARTPWSLRVHAAVVTTLLVLAAAAVYFTVGQPHVGVRFVLISVSTGVLFLCTSFSLARGGVHNAPLRHMFAVAAGVHGLFLLIRPWLFRLNEGEGELLQLISQFVVLESIAALILMAFGVLMLANEHMTLGLRELAEMDPLTRVFNRRAFLELLDKAVSSARRMQVDLPVLVIDLDHFKNINDSWGHKTGDDVLRHFTRLAGLCLRREDVIGRLGGEEFAVFLPNASLDGAYAVAQRICAILAEQPVATDHGPVTVTASIGLTLCASADSSEMAVQRADKAMYLAKERGRNRVEVLAPGLAAVG